MNDENKNRYILVIAIVLLLVSVIVVGVFLVISGKSNAKDMLKVELKQVYASEYDIEMLNDSFYIGKYKDSLSAIIDKNGLEVFTSNYEIAYDNFYKMSNGNYLFYDVKDKELVTYIFNGNDFKQSFSYEVLGDVKPVLFGDLIISFAYNYDDKLYLLDINNGTNVIVNDVYLDSFLVNNNYLIVRNNKNKYGVIDLVGNVIIPYSYISISGTLNNTFIVNDGTYEYVLDVNGTIINKAKFKKIYSFKNYYLGVNNKNMMSLYDIEMNALTEVKMDYDDSEIILYEFYEKLIVKVDGAFYVVGDEVNYIFGDLYKVGNGFAYFNDSILHILDDDLDVFNEITFEDEVLDVVFENNYIKILFKNEENEYIRYYNSKFELLSAKDNLLYLSDKYYVYFNEKDDIDELVITDLDNNVINFISGREIVLHGDYVIVDSFIYKIVVS